MEEVNTKENTPKNPLVSIIVITYNSSKYVLETLESAKAQTYHNIELIITDDASQDDTVQICKAWLDQNRERFVRTELVTIEKNTGTSANCNRGLKTAEGEWLKFIAGDDVMDLNYLNCLKNVNADKKLICGSLIQFTNQINDDLSVSWPNFEFPNSAKKQLKLQLIGGFITAPSVLMKSEMLVSVGGFDEDYKLYEDDPLWIKFLLKGYQFIHIPNSTVYYRNHEDAVTKSKKNCIYNKDFFYDQLRFRRKIIYPLLKNENLYFWLVLLKFEEFLKRIIIKTNKRNFINSTLLKFMPMFRILRNKQKKSNH